LMLESIRKEYLKSRILLSLGDGALTIKEMANGVGLSPGEVLKNLVVMERDRLISVSHIEGNSPRYRTLGG
jgi:predicted ArsR family transcriptional regulator